MHRQNGRGEHTHTVHGDTGDGGLVERCLKKRIDRFHALDGSTNTFAHLWRHGEDEPRPEAGSKGVLHPERGLTHLRVYVGVSGAAVVVLAKLGRVAVTTPWSSFRGGHAPLPSSDSVPRPRSSRPGRPPTCTATLCPARRLPRHIYKFSTHGAAHQYEFYTFNQHHSTLTLQLFAAWLGPLRCRPAHPHNTLYSFE
jgi:hypothetical protein